MLPGRSFKAVEHSLNTLWSVLRFMGSQRKTFKSPEFINEHHKSKSVENTALKSCYLTRKCMSCNRLRNFHLVNWSLAVLIFFIKHFSVFPHIFLLTHSYGPTTISKSILPLRFRFTLKLKKFPVSMVKNQDDIMLLMSPLGRSIIISSRWKKATNYHKISLIFDWHKNILKVL